MAKTKLLIIHRDDQSRKEIHHIISRFDFDITYAKDGLQGLYSAKHTVPDVIICQVDIPELNGIELGATFKKDPVLKNSALILLHDQLDLDVLNKAKLIDARAFLIEPYIDNSLIYAVKRALNVEKLEINENKTPVSYDDCHSKVLTGYKFLYA